MHLASRHRLLPVSKSTWMHTGRKPDSLFYRNQENTSNTENDGPGYPPVTISYGLRIAPVRFLRNDWGVPGISGITVRQKRFSPGQSAIKAGHRLPDMHATLFHTSLQKENHETTPDPSACRIFFRTGIRNSCAGCLH